MFEIKYRPEKLDYETFARVDGPCFPDEPIESARFTEMLTQDFWAAFDDQGFIGFGYVVLKPAFAWIARVGVGPGRRGRGVGTRLMETMLEHCRKHGRSRVILYVMQDNAAAIRLYHKFGFSERETTYQYVVPIRKFLDSCRRPPSGAAETSGPAEASGSSQAAGPAETFGPVTAVPINEADPEALPSFPEEWADIASMHDPPKNHVLIFMTDKAETTGFCRLSPEFPGCFPFVVDGSPVNRLARILCSLERYLNPGKEILKLTFPDGTLADECERLGFKLNYKLFKMEKAG
jgi:GNAT superfamily N-acetyltransferase